MGTVSPVGINCPVEVGPLAGDPDIRFVNPPRPVRMPEVTAKPQIQNGRIVLHPAPNADVVHRQAAFRHHFF